MPKSKIKINIGDIFMVPLRSGGYGIGLVVRKHNSIVLGYFWKEKFSNIPIEFDLSILKKKDSFWIKQFGIRGLEKGTWQIVGNMPDFEKKEWEIPKFIREVDSLGKYMITYNDKLESINEERVPDDFEGNYPQDGLAGYGFIELKLTRYLNQE